MAAVRQDAQGRGGFEACRVPPVAPEIRVDCQCRDRWSQPQGGRLHHLRYRAVHDRNRMGADQVTVGEPEHLRSARTGAVTRQSGVHSCRGQGDVVTQVNGRRSSQHVRRALSSEGLEALSPRSSPWRWDRQCCSMGPPMTSLPWLCRIRQPSTGLRQCGGSDRS